MSTLQQTPKAVPSQGDEPVERPQAAWLVVASREIVVKLTDKNFVISTIVTLALLAGSFALQAVLAGGQDKVSVVAVGPQSRQVLEQVSTTADERTQSLDLTVTGAADAATASQQVRDGDVDVALVHEGQTWRLLAKDSPDATLTALVREAVSTTTLQTNAAAAGTTAAALTAGSTLETQSLEAQQDENVRYVVGFVFAFLFYLASLLFGMTIASSVVEEKQSRVVEILVTAVPVRQLLLGKVAGNTAMALAQMVLFVGVGLIGVSFTSFSDILPGVAAASGWFLVFFLAGFVALACLWAVAGSLATRNEDLQSTTPILTTVLVVAMMIGLLGDGLVRTIGSYVPVVSTVAMPQRLFAGDAAWWEPIVSLLITLAFAVVAVTVGERLYSRTLLQTQRKLGIREAMRVEV